MLLPNITGLKTYYQHQISLESIPFYRVFSLNKKILNLINIQQTIVIKKIQV